MAEQFSNNTATTLSAAITTPDATTCTVASASDFPTSGNFRIKIDGEILIVTSVAGTTFTITRGAENTAAATHASGAAVIHLLTKGGLEARVADRFISDAYANKPAAGVQGRLFLPTDGIYLEYDDGADWHKYGPYRRLKPPPQTGWEWVNQGNATVTYTDAGVLVLEDPTYDANDPELRLYMRRPAKSPIDVTMAYAWNGIHHDGVIMGFCSRQVGGTEDGQFTVLGNASVGSSHQWRLRHITYSSPTAVETYGTYSTSKVHHSPLFWWRFTVYGNKKRDYYSTDGINFDLHRELTITENHTPNQIGICIDPTNNGQGASMSLVHWEEN